MEIALGADHAGFDLKEKIKGELQRLGHGVRDLGTDSDESVDYPDYAARVCRLVTGGQAGRGILVCGTGVGMSVAANKLPGIRAANVCSEAAARLSREHNDANVLSMGQRMLAIQEALEIVDLWLAAAFAGGRHATRIRMIDEA